MDNGVTTIRIELSLEANFDQNLTETEGFEYIEGKKLSGRTQLTREMKLRAECIRYTEPHAKFAISTLVRFMAIWAPIIVMSSSHP